MVTAEGQAKIMDFGIARLNLTHLTSGRRTSGYFFFERDFVQHGHGLSAVSGQ